MAVDRSFVELNRASSRRMRELVMRLTNDELLKPVGKEWTVHTTLAHIAFWDLRVMHLLDATEREGKLVAPEIDISVNDILNMLFGAMRPRLISQMAFQAAESLDGMLEKFPADLLEQIHARTERWVIRALHRNHHLDAIEAAVFSPEATGKKG
jgi:hypothetical protein